MRIAFVIYERMTTLDFLGVYDALTRLRTMGFRDDVEWDICARTPDVHDNAGLHLVPTRVNEPLRGYDLLVVPGGVTSRKLADDAAMIEWMRTAADTPLKASVCTGALLLGAAGFLVGRRATTHPTAFDDLRNYCTEVVDERVVDTGDVITARGVTSSIDLGLYLVQRFNGREVRQRIQRQMDYPYYPYEG